MTKNKGKILVVDDNAGIRSALKILLQMYFEESELLSSPVELMSKMASFRPDAVLLDMNFNRDINTGNEGLFWLSELKNAYPDTPVILFTAYADIALAVEGMKRGAYDFIVKPWDNDKLIKTLSEACSNSRKSRQPATRKDTPEQMRWGESPAMLSLKKLVEKVSPTDATVLITGENGTGKDMLACEIHRLSSRSGKPMVCVDLGAITETLFESELFGHVKGAFTDAKNDHAGKFVQADGGTLFLDEIGNIPPHLQSKLLRVLQNRSVTPVGSAKSVPVDIRLICATNMDLEEMVRKGSFREDLYYRINTMQVHLPPLRDRKDEIIPLAESFTRLFSEKYRKHISGADDKAKEILLRNRWNGNIRELRNCIEKAVIISESPLLSEEDLSLSVSFPSAGGQEIPAPEYAADETLDMVEERTIRAAVAKYNGNLSMVAKTLNISRPTLYAKLKKYNI